MRFPTDQLNRRLDAPAAADAFGVHVSACSQAISSPMAAHPARTRYLAALILAAAGVAPAQEALRYSMAGEAAAQSQRLQQLNQPYFLKSGDFRLGLEPSVEVAYSDNINLSKSPSQDDVIFKPMLRANASYPLTQQNWMRVNLGVGYNYFIKHPEYSSMSLESGSALAFDFYVKDLAFNVHDRFQYVPDPATESALSQTAKYAFFQNIAGLSATWDLQDVTLTLGYDHLNYINTTAGYEYIDHSSEMFTARAGLRLNPVLTTGVEGTASFTGYDQPVLNDSMNYSAGIYGEWHPGAALSFTPRLGYTIYDFEQTSLYMRAVNENAWYADLSIMHQPTDAISYGFSVGQDMRLGMQADLIKTEYVRPNITWKFHQNMSLTANLFYNHGQQGGGKLASLNENTYDWYGGGLGLSAQIVKHLQIGLNYRLTMRSTDTGTGGYTQNRVGLTFTYTF